MTSHPAATDDRLRARTWDALERASTPLSVEKLADRAHITNGCALAFCRDWTAAGRLVCLPEPGRPAPYLDRYARPAHLDRSPPVTSSPAPGPSTGPIPEPATGTAAYAELLLTAALDHAARGWHVFPLVPGEKRPAVKDWESRATTEAARIERCWQHVPATGPYGIGIACGPSALAVIDLDTPKPGQATPEAWQLPGVRDGGDVLAVLADRAGAPMPFADTYTVTTPSGGTHLYYTAPDARDPVGGTMRSGVSLRNTAGTLGWLIDSRAHGGYVVAPPTRTTAGAYRIAVTAPVADLPHWLTKALTPAPLPPQEPVHVRLRAETSRPGDPRRVAYLTSAVNRAMAAVLASEAGQHNRALYGAAVQLGQLIAGSGLPAETVTEALLIAGTVVGQSENEARKTIASGLRAGAGRPRTLGAAA